MTRVGVHSHKLNPLDSPPYLNKGKQQKEQKVFGALKILRLTLPLRLERTAVCDGGAISLWCLIGARDV